MGISFDYKCWNIGGGGGANTINPYFCAVIDPELSMELYDFGKLYRKRCFQL